MEKSHIHRSMVLKDIITEFQCFSLLWRPQISEFKVCLRVAPVAGDNKRARARDHPRSYIYFSRSFHVKTGKFGGEIHPASRTCTPLDMSKNLASIFSDQNRQIWGAGVKSEHAWQTCTPQDQAKIKQIGSILTSKWDDWPMVNDHFCVHRTWSENKLSSLWSKSKWEEGWCPLQPI